MLFNSVSGSKQLQCDCAASIPLYILWGRSYSMNTVQAAAKRNIIFSYVKSFILCSYQNVYRSIKPEEKASHYMNVLTHE